MKVHYPVSSEYTLSPISIIQTTINQIAEFTISKISIMKINLMPYHFKLIQINI